MRSTANSPEHQEPRGLGKPTGYVIYEQIIGPGKISGKMLAANLSNRTFEHWPAWPTLYAEYEHGKREFTPEELALIWRRP